MRKHRIIDAKKTDDGNREIEMCEAPEKCGTCLMVLRHIETAKIQSFVYSRRTNDAYELAFQIEPTPDFILYQNLLMIEDLVYAIFKEIPEEYDVEFADWNLGIAVEFIPDHHFSYPVLEVRLFILGEVSENLLLLLRRIALQDLERLVGKSGVLHDISNLTDSELIDAFKVKRPFKRDVSSIFSTSEQNPYGTDKMREQLKFIYHFPFHTIDTSEVRNRNFQIKSFHEDVYGISDTTKTNG